MVLYGVENGDQDDAVLFFFVDHLTGGDKSSRWFGVGTLIPKRQRFYRSQRWNSHALRVATNAVNERKGLQGGKGKQARLAFRRAPSICLLIFLCVCVRYSSSGADGRDHP